jgi:hypothetical protein
LFGDVQSLRDGRYPQAPDLHKRWVNLGRLCIFLDPGHWSVEQVNTLVTFQLVKVVLQFGVCDLYPL